MDAGTTNENTIANQAGFKSATVGFRSFVASLVILMAGCQIHRPETSQRAVKDLANEVLTAEAKRQRVNQLAKNERRRKQTLANNRSAAKSRDVFSANGAALHSAYANAGHSAYANGVRQAGLRRPRCLQRRCLPRQGPASYLRRALA